MPDSLSSEKLLFIMFDIYKEWFNIPEDQRPPNYYQLLGIRDFESDDDVINRASRERMQFLRNRQLDSRYEEEVQQLLNEVARARVTLRNPKTKDTYDLKLRESKGTAGEAVIVKEPRSIGDIDVLAEQIYDCLNMRNFEMMHDLLKKLRSIRGNEAQERRSQERLRGIFDTCIVRAQRAINEQKYDEVMIYTGEALGIFPNDAAAQKLRLNAQNAMFEERAAREVVTPEPKHQPSIDDRIEASADTATPTISTLLVKKNAIGPVVKRSWATQIFMGSCLAAGIAALATVAYIWFKYPEPNKIFIIEHPVHKGVPLKSSGQGTKTHVRLSKPIQKAIEHSAKQERYAEIKYNGVEELLKAGEQDKAKKALELLIEEYPKTNSATRARKLLVKLNANQTAKKLYWFGMTAFDNKDYERAIELWTQLIEKFPNNSLSEQAREQMQKAKEEIYNQNAKRLYDKAEESRRQGRLNDAFMKFMRLYNNYNDWKNIDKVKKALKELGEELGYEIPDLDHHRR